MSKREEKQRLIGEVMERERYRKSEREGEMGRVKGTEVGRMREEMGKERNGGLQRGRERVGEKRARWEE